jgi:RNase P/RNase MRP subunit p29
MMLNDDDDDDDDGRNNGRNSARASRSTMKKRSPQIHQQKYTWMKEGKTLSKNLLYTPLQEYQDAAAEAAAASSSQNRSVLSASTILPIDDSQSTTTATKNTSVSMTSSFQHQRHKVPKAISEPTFVEFMYNVSQDYHRNLATTKDAKNNGCKPLSQDQMDDRVRSRAVTLIGGGIYNNNKKSTTNLETSQMLRKRRRRKRTWEQIESVLCRSNNSNSDIQKKTKRDDDTTSSIEFLRVMNARWKEYILGLIIKSPPPTTGSTSSSSPNRNESIVSNDQEVEMMKRRLGFLLSRKPSPRPSKKPSSTTSSSLSAAAAAVSTTNNKTKPKSKIEIVGALVQIQQCPSRREWIGRYGVIVDETTNTLRLAVYSSKRIKKRKRGKTKKNADETEVEEQQQSSDERTMVTLKNGETTKDDDSGDEGKKSKTCTTHVPITGDHKPSITCDPVDFPKRVEIVVLPKKNTTVLFIVSKEKNDCKKDSKITDDRNDESIIPIEEYKSLLISVPVEL